MARTTDLGCVGCLREQKRDHAPIPPEFCGACGESYYDGCGRTHHHDAWIGCYDYVSDIRQFECGHYGHKNCCKSGGTCCGTPAKPRPV